MSGMRTDWHTIHVQGILACLDAFSTISVSDDQCNSAATITPDAGLSTLD